MTDFHTRLSEAVQKSGRSARDISLAARLSPGTLSDILRKHSSPSVDNLKAIARALGVPFAWLAEGRTSNAAPPGFSESEVRPWIPPKAGGQRPDLEPGRAALIRTLAPDARHPATFQTASTTPAFGLVAGDVLIIDSNAGEPANGELVIATVADLTTGAAITVVRRLLKPYLVSGDPETDTTPLIADGARTVIMGPVVAVFRAPQLTQWNRV